MEKELVIINILPANMEAEIQKAVQMREALDKLFNDVLKEKIDYGRIPGTDKPTIFKAGAELLCQVFHLAPGKPEVVHSLEDFKEGLLSYMVSVPITHRDTGMLVSAGIGSANSQEIKYKYRNVPIEGSDEREKILNPEPADQQNTLVKMAAKRAFVDAVLKATGASRMFTQDLEDMPWLSQEKASSKQVGYIRSLYKGVSDIDTLAEMSSIVGRDIGSFDDILRTEATKIIDHKKGNEKSSAKSTQANPSSAPSSGNAQSGQPAEKYHCTGYKNDCRVEITKAEFEFSDRQYGKPLCRKCQTEAKKERAKF